MMYFITKYDVFLIMGLLLSQSILSMNISGDITPINISSHEHRNVWPVSIPGDISPAYCKDTQLNNKTEK